MTKLLIFLFLFTSAFARFAPSLTSKQLDSTMNALDSTYLVQTATYPGAIKFLNREKDILNSDTTSKKVDHYAYYSFPDSSRQYFRLEEWYSKNPNYQTPADIYWVSDSLKNYWILVFINTDTNNQKDTFDVIFDMSQANQDTNDIPIHIKKEGNNAVSYSGTLYQMPDNLPDSVVARANFTVYNLDTLSQSDSLSGVFSYNQGIASFIIQ